MPQEQSKPSYANRLDWSRVTVVGQAGRFGQAEAVLHAPKESDGPQSLVGVISIKGTKSGPAAIVEGFGLGTKELLDRGISKTIIDIGHMRQQPPVDHEIDGVINPHPKRSWRARMPVEAIESVASALSTGHGSKGLRIAEGLRAALRIHVDVNNGRIPERVIKPEETRAYQEAAAHP
jgi:hypothetical protein